MGEIDWKPFQHMCSQKFPGMDWKKISAVLCSKWQERLRNPQWQPFKIVMLNGEPQVCSFTFSCRCDLSISCGLIIPENRQLWEKIICKLINVSIKSYLHMEVND